jgi:hypothetical protein
MTNSYDSTAALNKALTRQRPTNAFMLYTVILPSFLLAGLCFGWYGKTGQFPLLLLGLVTLGMTYDFLSHVLGMYMRQRANFLLWYARINFCALCFGIPFTAFAGIFVLAEVNPAGISTQFVKLTIPLLIGSIAFGTLFLFARYKQTGIDGALEYTLDKSHRFTNNIFLARRVVLALTLILGIIVVIDGWNTDWRLWSLLFTGSFIATIPLHIMRKQFLSMASELVTQATAVYGTWQVFVAANIAVP